MERAHERVGTGKRRREGGIVHKDLARAVGSLLDLVVGVAVLHIELYALEKVMHATASAGYVAFWVLFWM